MSSSRIQLHSPAPESITLSHSTSAYKDDDGREAKSSSHATTVCNTDLTSAGTYITVVGTNIPHLIHGVTRLRLSDKSFKEVKSSGKVSLEFLDFLQVGSDAVKPIHDAGLLTRVEPQRCSLPHDPQ